MIHLPVDPDDLPRVRGILDGTIAPVEPRPAVTVVLLRDGAEGLEVLLMRRNPRLAFAAGQYVFPGGSVDASDAEHAPWVGAVPDDARSRIEIGWMLSVIVPSSTRPWIASP